MKIYNNLNKTKLIATMGPSFEDPKFIEKMLKSGVTTVRLNTSHGDFEEHGNRINLIKKIRKELDLPISIMLDTKGPEIRIHTIKDKKFEVKIGDILEIHTKKEIVGENGKFSITYEKLPNSIKIGQEISIDDGKLTLKVKDINKTTGVVKVTVENHHYIATKKAVNIPGVDLEIPFLSSYDKNFIKWGIEQGIDLVAASFVNKKEDLIELRNFLDKNNGSHVDIMSKIEALNALVNINDIIHHSDSIMIARGDLGVEIPFEKVPFYTELIINKCRAQAKPVVVATQMLDSMIENPKPTRAEVTDIYFSGILGADSTMLSGESASGKFPLDAVQTMNLINYEAQKNFNYSSAYSIALATTVSKNTEIAYQIARKALYTDCKYIIAFSTGGKLLKALSAFRPNAAIFGMLQDRKRVHSFGYSYGIYAQHYPSQKDFSSDDKIRKIAQEIGINKGIKIIVANSLEIRVIRI